MSIQELRERLAASSKAANKLLADNGDRVWSKEDQTSFDNIADEVERLQSQIQAHQRAIEFDRDVNFTDVEHHRIGRNEKNGKKLTDAQKAMNIFVHKSFNQMSVEEALLVRNTMSTTTGSEGGFTVKSEVASELIEAMKSYGFMRKVASQMTTASGKPLSYSTSDGTSEEGEWVDQNSSADTQDVTFGTVPLNVHKVSSKVITVPFELLQDSEVDIQAMLYRRISDRIGRTSNKGYSNGDGLTMPFGIGNVAGIGKVGANGQTNTISYDDLVEMVDSLDVAYTEDQANRPSWMFNQSLRKVLRKIKDGAGRPIWTPSYDAGISGGFSDQLLDYKVNINNAMPAPAANAKSLAFGNFRSYMIRDAMEATIFRFDDSAYIKKGQIGFMAWARTGGNLLDVNAVKLYQHSAA